jgi:hypothetical protein
LGSGAIITSFGQGHRPSVTQEKLPSNHFGCALNRETSSELCPAIHSSPILPSQTFDA